MSFLFSKENERIQSKEPLDFFQSATLGGLLLVLITFVVYIPAMNGGFVWDDEVFIVNNPLILSASGLWKIWVHPTLNPDRHYWPLAYTSLWLDYRIWGLNPLGYHLMNTLIHALNGILLWRILRRLMVPGAWFAAAIFAVHPVHVESVAWIFERKDVLSGLFYFLSFWFYLNYDSQKNGKSYFLSLFFFLCAIWTKSITLSLPLAILLWMWWKKERVEKKDLWTLVPFVVLGVVCFGLDYLSGQDLAPFETDLTILQRVILAGRVLWFSAGKLIAPVNLMAYYPRWKLDGSFLLQYVYPVSWAILLALLFGLKKIIGKGWFVGAAYFVVTLGPNLGLIDYSFLAYGYVADRFQYLACIGLITLFAAVLCRDVTCYVSTIKFRAHLIVIIPLIILSVFTWRQAGLYKDMETLIRYNMAKNPNAWATHYNLAVVLARQGKDSDAVQEYLTTLELNPNYAEAHNNLALLLAQEGKTDEAMRHYNEAIRVNPRFAEAYNNRAILLIQQGKSEEAMADYQKAIDYNPQFAEAYNNLGLVLAKQGKLEEAIGYFSKAIEINPNYNDAKRNLDVVLAAQKLQSKNGEPVK